MIKAQVSLVFNTISIHSGHTRSKYWSKIGLVKHGVTRFTISILKKVEQNTSSSWLD